jgi:transketolase
MRDHILDLYEPGDPFRMGGSHVVIEGTDVTIVSYGDIVFEAIGAAGILAKNGIRAEVIDMYSVKPFDREGLLKSLDKTGALVVAENHQRRNGLGYELSNFCLKNKVVPFENLGLEDTFAESGSYGKLLEKYGLSRARIAEAAKRILGRV